MKPIQCFFFLQLLWLSAIGQKQHIKFEHFGTDQGLSQSNVICILQDSRGFMWFGTRDGLNKYDGYKCTVYKNDADDSASIGNNFIRAITESRNGDIWVATSGGLCRYDRNTNRFTRYRHNPANNKSISNDVVTSVLEDSEGSIWVGTETGLNRFDRGKNQFTRFTYDPNDKNSLGNAFVRTVFEDSQHNLWVGTYSGGLNLFNRKNKTFKRFQHNEKDSRSISNNNVYVLFEDSRHRLWVGTTGGGLNLLNRSSGEFSHYRHDDNHNSLAGDEVFAINEDNQHNLWIGTENRGLSIFDPQKEMFYSYQYDAADHTSLINNSIYAICKDEEGNMWLGTFNGGVDRVDPDAQKFAHYRHILSKNSLSDNNVLSIIEDSKKNIWIGTDGGGLNLFDPKTAKFTHFRYKQNDKNSICGDYVLSVCEDSRGNIWVGTWGGGVTVFNRTRHSFMHFKNDPADPASLSNNNAWKIFEDKEKNIWIGTYGGGLNLYDPLSNSFTHYQVDEKNTASISSNNIQSIFEDSEGKLWISTDGGGLNLFNKATKTFSRFLHSDRENSICDNSAGSICEDRNKNLWIGTMSGLSCLERKTNQFINYTTKDGLPNNVIFGILEDDKGQLWISTNKGIARFDPVRKLVKNFGVSDGLQSNEFKQQAFCKSSAGSMYFGGTNGFNQFFPDSIKDNPYVPPLVITGLQIFNKEILISDDATISPLKKNITETKELTLSYKHSVITFEFASLHYTATAEKKQYAYMLEGFDKGWNYIGTKRTATYTNLDPGTYNFKVKSLNHDGSWSEAVTNLKLAITPPFWRTWWFRSLVILFIIGCFVSFYQIRVKTIKRQKAILEKQVQERTEKVVSQQKELSNHIEVLATLKESLEHEKYLLDSLMDHMPDAIYFKDSESKFVRVSKYMVNKHLANNPGATIDDLIGKSDFDLQDERHAREAYEDEQEIQRTGKPKIDYIEKEIREDGSERWVTTTKLPLFNPQGEVVGTFGISRDVTKIKMLEQERHEAELDKAVAQGKFELASDVMHDIGNAVVGFGSYLTRIRRLQTEDSADNLKNLASFFEKQKEAIATVIGTSKSEALINMLSSMSQTQKTNQEEINRSITEQLNIVTSIQEILHIQRQYITGHESQERKPVNMRNIINDSLSMVFASFDKMGIDVSLNMDAELPIIKGDRTKLMQLLLNVLRNSIEAIDINAVEKNIDISTFSHNDTLVLKIKDSGKGFDTDTAGKLFSKGFTTKSTASGLGLYSCRAIMESHEGTIQVKSTGQGKGAVTTLQFKI